MQCDLCLRAVRSSTSAYARYALRPAQANGPTPVRAEPVEACAWPSTGSGRTGASASRPSTGSGRVQLRHGLRQAQAERVPAARPAPSGRRRMLSSSATPGTQCDQRRRTAPPPFELSLSKRVRPSTGSGRTGASLGRTGAPSGRTGAWHGRLRQAQAERVHLRHGLRQPQAERVQLPGPRPSGRRRMLSSSATPGTQCDQRRRTAPPRSR